MNLTKSIFFSIIGILEPENQIKSIEKKLKKGVLRKPKRRGIMMVKFLAIMALFPIFALAEWGEQVGVWDGVEGHPHEFDMGPRGLGYDYDHGMGPSGLNGMGDWRDCAVLGPTPPAVDFPPCLIEEGSPYQGMY